MTSLKDKAKKLKLDIPTVYIALRKKETPIIAKVFALITIIYALSPIDLIPDFIPVIGFLDDLILLPILISITVKLIPKEVFTECRVEAEGLWNNGKPKKWYYSLPIILIWGLILVFLTGCNNVKFKEYNGEGLNIGVIGETPNVREENIKFNNIEFEDLLNESTLIKYDAIFITKENLSEASKKEYAAIYNECVVPFFFIGSNKLYIPFIREDLSYEDVPQLEDPPSYSVGIFKESDGLSFVGYGLYNYIENKKNVEDVYSRMFTSIAEKRGN